MYNIYQNRVIITNSSGEERLLEYIHSLSYVNNIDQLGARMEIECPLNIVTAYDEKNNSYLVAPLRTLVYEGDRVSIFYGYEGEQEINIFNGYVYMFKDGQPSTIICEDEKYNLRKGVLNKTWSKPVMLKELLQYAIKDSNLVLNENNVDLKFETFGITNVSPLGVLEKLKSDLRLIFCIIKNTLYCSLVPTNQVATQNFSSDQNVFSCDIQQNEGSWKTFTIKVNRVNSKGKKEVFYMSNIFKNNKQEFVKTDLSSGQGTYKQINAFKLSDADSTQLAQNAIKKLKLGEYEGSLSVMIYPNTEELSFIGYTDITFPNRSGTYFITEKKISVSPSGGAKQFLRLAQINN